MIDALASNITISYACRHLGVNRGSFYAWKRSCAKKISSKKFQICKKIRDIFWMSKKTYGSPRIHAELVSKGIAVCENTVATYMREMGLSALLKKKFRVQTTDSKHNDPIAPRRFKAEEELPSRPYEVLAGDITYLKIHDRFYYLAIVMDLFNRQILGWQLSKSLDANIVISALKKAMRHCSPKTKVIFHSDRGSQYASKVFRDLLRDNNFVPSMSRKGNCYDNCDVESWFKSFKTKELLSLQGKL